MILYIGLGFGLNIGFLVQNTDADECLIQNGADLHLHIAYTIAYLLIVLVFDKFLDINIIILIFFRDKLDQANIFNIKRDIHFHN